MNRNTLAALSLAAALTLSLAACGGGTTGTAETPAPESTAPVTESAAPADQQNQRSGGKSRSWPTVSTPARRRQL